MQLDGVLKRKPEKFRLPGFKPWHVWYRCSALTNFRASKPTGSWSLDWFIIYWGKIIVMIFSVFISSSCSSNNYMKFIYLLFQENNNKYYTRSKNTCVTEFTKKTTTQPRWFQFSLFENPNQGRPMQGSESGQRSVTDFPLLLNSKWPNVLRVELITRKTHDTAHDNRNCDRLFVIPFTAWPVNGYFRMLRLLSHQAKKTNSRCDRKFRYKRHLNEMNKHF